jgi:hypothetical protein
VNAKLAGRRGGGMLRLYLKNGCDMTLSLTAANEPAVAARAERQGERIEENGLSGAGFSRQDRQARSELEIEPIN